MSNNITLEECKQFMPDKKNKYFYPAQQFSDYCTQQDLPLKTVNLAEWLEWLRMMGKSAGTIRTYAFAVKARLKHLEWVKEQSEECRILALYRIDQEFQDLKLPRPQKIKGRKTLLTLEQLREMIRTAPDRPAVAIEFLASTGLRVSEMCEIQKKHIRKHTEKEFRIRIFGKGRKERTIRINSGLRRRIEEAFHGLEYLFESEENSRLDRSRVFRWVQTAGRKVGIDDCHPHLLRHFFATHLYNKTGDISAVSRYMGHSSETITWEMYHHESELGLVQLELGLWGDRGKIKPEKPAEEKEACCG